MKKIVFFTFLVLLTINAYAKDSQYITKDETATVTFTFDNAIIINGWFEFDIMLESDIAGRRLGDNQEYINYNYIYFGSNVYNNGNIQVEKGTLLQGDIAGSPLYSLVNVTDNTLSRVAITYSYLFESAPGWANVIPTYPTQLLHIAMKVTDNTSSPGFSYQQAMMIGQSYESDNETKFDVIATDTINNSFPYADFTSDITSGNLPLQVNFIDMSIPGYSDIEEWNWDFQNDGIIDSYEQNPTFIYYESGTYDVYLSVSDGISKSNSISIKYDYITVNTASEPLIAVSPDSLDFGHVWVDSTVTLPIWVHNYGVPDLEVSNILCSTDKFSVSLPQAKDISFTVASMDSQQVYIHFTPQDTVDYSANIIFFSNDPVHGVLLTDVYGTGYDFYANFGADQTTGDVPLEVTFMDSSAGDIVSWYWDFGDGDSSTVQNTTHTYQYDGVYDVSLTVEDTYHSNTITKLDYITAIGHPEIYTQDSLGFEYGVVYLSDISGDSIIVIENTGTDTVLVSDVSFINDTNGFHYSYNHMGIPIPPNCMDTLYVNFEPLLVQTYEDTLLITNNSENKPLLKIPLYGTGEYVPPASPEGLVIDIQGVNVQLTWNPVDSTIYGEPLTPDGYIILNNEEPYDEQFSFLGFTSDTTYTHVFIAQYRDHMYYKVVAYKDFEGKNIKYW